MNDNDEEFLKEKVETIFDILRLVKDPERDATLEELLVLQEEKIKVSRIPGSVKLLVEVEFVPTLSHCSLATLIGLCIRVKLARELPFSYKIRINVAEGSHDDATAVTKQINDKERVAAAMENSVLRDTVDRCINME